MTAPNDGAAGPALELRSLVGAALDRLQPVVDRLSEAPPTGAEHVSSAVPAACGVCPICALIAVLRGERPELAVRLAEQAGGWLTALRAALDEEAPVEPDPTQRRPEAAGRDVQRIPVKRTDPSAP